MKKVTGLFIMATLAFAGVMGIHYFLGEKNSEKIAFSKLKTKLQKTLVLMEESSDKSVVKSEKLPAKTIVKVVRDRSVRSSAILSFSARKEMALNSMNKAFSSLLSVRHIFRHEITEMIEIIKESQPSQSKSRKISYAKNWSSYVKKNVSKFNMNEQSRKLVTTMVSDMRSFIANMNKVVKTPTAIKKNTPKVPRAIDISSLNNSGNIQRRLMKKSIMESLVAIKDLETIKKVSSTLNKGLTFSWILACCIFALVGVWMSRAKVESLVEKIVVAQNSDEIEMNFEQKTSDIPDIPEVIEEVEIPAVPYMAIMEEVHVEPENELVLDFEALEVSGDEFSLSVNDELESTIDVAVEEFNDVEEVPMIGQFIESHLLELNSEEEMIEETFLFDDIANNLSTLCQAKGVRLHTVEAENTEETIEKFNLENIGLEIEGFVKTVIRSLGRDSEKEIKIHLKDADKKVKIIAAVSGDNSFDINMKDVASSFRELEDKLATRKGVFNIDQGVLGNDINFVMQVAAEQVKSEDENVEKAQNDQGMSFTV